MHHRITHASWSSRVIAMFIIATTALLSVSAARAGDPAPIGGAKTSQMQVGIAFDESDFYVKNGQWVTAHVTIITNGHSTKFTTLTMNYGFNKRMTTINVPLQKTGNISGEYAGPKVNGNYYAMYLPLQGAAKPANAKNLKFDVKVYIPNRDDDKGWIQSLGKVTDPSLITSVSFKAQISYRNPYYSGQDFDAWSLKRILVYKN